MNKDTLIMAGIGTMFVAGLIVIVDCWGKTQFNKGYISAMKKAIIDLNEINDMIMGKTKEGA